MQLLTEPQRFTLDHGPTSLTQRRSSIGHAVEVSRRPSCKMNEPMQKGQNLPPATTLQRGKPPSPTESVTSLLVEMPLTLTPDTIGLHNLPLAHKPLQWAAPWSTTNLGFYRLPFYNKIAAQPADTNAALTSQLLSEFSGTRPNLPSHPATHGVLRPHPRHCQGAPILVTTDVGPIYSVHPATSATPERHTKLLVASSSLAQQTSPLTLVRCYTSSANSRS